MIDGLFDEVPKGNVLNHMLNKVLKEDVLDYVTKEDVLDNEPKEDIPKIKAEFTDTVEFKTEAKLMKIYVALGVCHNQRRTKQHHQE